MYATIEHVRSVNHQWIAYTMFWQKTARIAHLLVQRCNTPPDLLEGLPAHHLLIALSCPITEVAPEPTLPSYINLSQTWHIVTVTAQSTPIATRYPSTWSLLFTPIVLAIGQQITAQEDHWSGAYIRNATITAIYALERTWVELVARLEPDATRPNGSNVIFISAPLTHVALPPTISMLRARYRDHLPEILATVNLPKPRPVTLTALRAPCELPEHENAP